MDKTPDQTTETLTTTGAFYTWIDTPMAIALLFALAGTIFVGIYLLRRLRNKPV